MDTSDQSTYLSKNMIIFLNMPEVIKRIVVMYAGQLLLRGPHDMTFEDALEIVMALTEGGYFAVH